MHRALTRTAILLLAHVAAFGAVTSGLQAQVVRGQVVDSITRSPVGTGFVVLIDGDGKELARALTAFDGRFSFTITPRQRGPFRLRSERIGFGVAQSDPFDAASAAATELTLWVGALPTPLTAIEVREATECRVRPSEDERTAVVWEEARKALAAASWTASRELFHIVSNVYRRTSTTRRRRVLRETHSPSIGNTSSPFVSRDPAALLQTGYITRDGEGISYFAPDAQVLQDEGFLGTHCFRLRNHDDRDELIGLAFEPVPSRRLPDVRGVLWLDRERSELRSLEYEYANLPRDLRSTTTAGGTLEFMPLPSGAWIVRQWVISIPTEFREERVSAFDREPRRVADQIRDVGGEVLTITNTDGSVAYQAPLAELTGVVMDHLHGDPVPIAGAVVEIADTWFADTTDQDGRFRIGAPLDGEYTVTLTHPRTESWGVLLPVREVELARNSTIDLTLQMPPMEDIMEDLCPNHPTGAYNRILVGWVRHFGGDIAPGVQVAASWQRIQNVSPPIQFRNMQDVDRTDARGHYTLCGLQTTRPTMVHAVTGDSRSELVRVAFEPTWIEVGDESFQTGAKIWRHDLVLRPNRELSTLVTGAITDASTGELIPGGVVTIVGTTDSSVADRTGVFRFEGLTPGTHLIVISHPGYAARTEEIEVYADQPTIISSEFLTLRREN
ncbi:MAG: carboxypeptidase regulatory-like domain-containing protein [Gemmatimonadetes bacterium]|nr:carboxypeptidase regulatory-like domain-containing protein [Gemmatimonadota bacterium]